MSKDKSFFELNPPKNLEVRIKAAASEALMENRKFFRRRRLMQWFMVPAFSSLGIFLAFQFWRNERNDIQIADFLDWRELNADDFVMISELELIEDLDILEEWEEV